MQAEGRYERNPDFVFRRIVDSLVLMPIRQEVADMDCIYTLNEIGATIWERLEGGASLAELQAAVANTYDVEPQVAAGDILEFMQQLEAEGAVRRA